MVGSSKILTVSYGTFSCTLEGFDDSFSTMKAIAEYFRDLASDDRYFGAEPPTPDADMLARIAEREVSRRVEAKLDDGNVVLKTGSALAVGAATTVAAEQIAAEQTDAAPLADPAPIADADADLPQATPDNAPPTGLYQAPETTEPVLQESVPEAPVMPPVARAPLASPLAAFTPLTPVSEDLAEDEAADEDYDEDADGASIASAPVADAPAAPTAMDHADANSVAAKLQRIRAVVGRGVDAPEVEDGSDAPNSLFVANTDDDPDDADQSTDISDESTDAPADTVAEDTPEDESAANFMAGLTDDTSDEDTPQEDDVADQYDTASLEDLAPELEGKQGDEQNFDALTDFMATQTNDVSPDVETPQDTSAQDDAEAIAEALDNTGSSDGQTGSNPVEPVHDDTHETAETQVEVSAPVTPAPVRARVIRMRRSEVDAAVATGSLVEKTSDDDAEPTAEVVDTASETTEETGTFEEAGTFEETGTFDIADLNIDDLDQAADTLTAQEETADLARLDGVDLDDTASLEDEVEDSSLTAEAEADLQAELAALVGGMETEDDAVVHNDTLSLDSADLIEDAAEVDLQETVDTFAEDVADDLTEALDTDLQDTAEDVAAPLMLDAGSIVDDAADVADETREDVAEDITAESDDNGTEQDGATEQDEATAAAAPRPRRVRMPGSIDEDPEAMSRIMSQTEAQMSEPDSSRRREAIAQLKAAVAATEADRDAGAASPSDAGDDEDVFRDDLRQAVRPTRPIRPQRPTARTERPSAAPLKLVASQRVDVTADDDAAPASVTPVRPVRPRRVSAAETAAPETDAPASQSGGFASFAEEMGASDLSDLLEAAAAYTSFVEGSEDFSRPQLMSKVQEMSAQEYSREEGLRSFGTLLRQGRIMKVRNGRFQVSDETRFNPERRAG